MSADLATSARELGEAIVALAKQDHENARLCLDLANVIAAHRRLDAWILETETQRTEAGLRQHWLLRLLPG